MHSASAAKKGLMSSGSTSPSTPVRRRARLRALVLGTYPSSVMARRIRSSVAGRTRMRPLSRRETVDGATSAARATSSTVAIWLHHPSPHVHSHKRLRSYKHSMALDRLSTLTSDRPSCYTDRIYLTVD